VKKHDLQISEKDFYDTFITLIWKKKRFRTKKPDYFNQIEYLRLTNQINVFSIIYL